MAQSAQMPSKLLQEAQGKRQALEQSSEDLGRRLLLSTPGEVVDLSACLQAFLEARIKYHTLSAKLQLTRLS
jgi:hypothetical protein